MPQFTRAELERYLARSRTVQRTSGRLGALGIVLAIVLLIAGAGVTVFLAVAALTGIVAGTGLWITHGHIADFEQQLRQLDRR